MCKQSAVPQPELRTHPCQQLSSAPIAAAPVLRGLAFASLVPAGKVSLQSLNSCLLPVYALDGAEVWTAEHLPTNADGQQPIAGTCSALQVR